MEETELEKFKATSLRYCDKLINDIRQDHDDIDRFFGGELYKAYVTATDKALTKAQNVRMKIRNL